MGKDELWCEWFLCGNCGKGNVHKTYCPDCGAKNVAALRPEEGEKPKNACAFDRGHSCCQPLTKPRPDGEEKGGV